MSTKDELADLKKSLQNKSWEEFISGNSKKIEPVKEKGKAKKKPSTDSQDQIEFNF